MMEPQIYTKEVIVVNSSIRGKGIEGSPIRRITQVLTKEGEIIAENDPLGNFTTEDMISFSEWLGNPNAVKCTDPIKTIEYWKNNHLL